jgi:hypothetical protein
MEGANEAARRAVNAILERSGSREPPCTIWNLHEPDALAPFRAYDRARYRAGLAWDGRFAKGVQAALAMAQDATGVTAGGAGPLAVVAPIAEALAAAGGPLSDPVAAQALSLIGAPAWALQGASDALPGLGAPAPGADIASAAAQAAAPVLADPVPSGDIVERGAAARPRLLRIRQKA